MGQKAVLEDSSLSPAEKVRRILTVETLWESKIDISKVAELTEEAPGIAKEIIEDEKSFLFPGYSVSRKDVEWTPDYQPYDYYQMPELQYREPYRAKCESVTLERKISDFVPDIIVSVRGKICLIEIAVTHFVDEEKQKKIESVGLPMVEVDLSSLHGQSLSREVIRDVLVDQTNGKTWVYNPLRKEALVWAASEYQRRYDALVEAEENFGFDSEDSEESLQAFETVGKFVEFIEKNRRK